MGNASCERERPTIVIVEDNTALAYLLETILQEEAGCRTRTYQSGTSVLERLDEIKESSPALFLIDYTLPGINGLSLCEHLHAVEETQKIPTILVTGSARIEVLEEAGQQGIPVMIKPYNLDELLEVVQQKIAAFA